MCQNDMRSTKRIKGQKKNMEEMDIDQVVDVPDTAVILLVRNVLEEKQFVNNWLFEECRFCG